MENNITIYTLSHPITKEIRYVGKTKQKDITFRLKQHIVNAKSTKESYYSVNWIKKLIRQDLLPTIEVLDICNESNWQEYEIFWISQLKSWGFNLTNTSEGGGINSTILYQPIIQYSLDEEFIRSWTNIHEAAMSLNISAGNIGSCCLKKRVSTGGFMWKYKDEIQNKKNQKSYNKDKVTEYAKSNQKKVIQYALDKKFIKKYNSIAEASRQTNIIGGNIVKCCLGKLQSSGGFIWEFSNKKNIIHSKKNKELLPAIRERVTNKKLIPILQFSLDGVFLKEWKSAREADESLNISYKCISGVCRGHRKTTGGFIWKFKDENRIIKPKYVDIRYIVNQYNLNNEFIQEFISSSEASRITKISRSHINAVCLGKRKSAGGFIWKYKDQEE